MSIYLVLIVLLSNYCFVSLKPFDDLEDLLRKKFQKNIKDRLRNHNSKEDDYVFVSFDKTAQHKTSFSFTTIKTVTESSKENQKYTVMFSVCILSLVLLICLVVLCCKEKIYRQSRRSVITMSSAQPSTQTARWIDQLERPIALQSQRVLTNHIENTTSNSVRETKKTANPVVEANYELDRLPSYMEVMAQQSINS